MKPFILNRVDNPSYYIRDGGRYERAISVPTVAKGWPCGWVGGNPGLHWINVNEDHMSLDHLQDMDNVRIQATSTPFDSYDIMYGSNAGKKKFRH